MRFCNDWDLLRREPALLREARVVASRLVTLNTTWSGVSGTVTAMTFDGDTPVRPGMLAWVVQRDLAGVVIGLGTQLLQVAMPHDLLPASAGTESPEMEAGPGDGATTTEVWTFPQTSAASARVALLLGVAEDDVTLDREPLREPAALWALASIFASLASLDRRLVNDGLGRGFTFADPLWKLAERYERLGWRAVRQLSVTRSSGALRPGTGVAIRG